MQIRSYMHNNYFPVYFNKHKYRFVFKTIKMTKRVGKQPNVFTLSVPGVALLKLLPSLLVSGPLLCGAPGCSRAPGAASLLSGAGLKDWSGSSEDAFSPHAAFRASGWPLGGAPDERRSPMNWCMSTQEQGACCGGTESVREAPTEGSARDGEPGRNSPACALPLQKLLLTKSTLLSLSMEAQKRLHSSNLMTNYDLEQQRPLKPTC